MFTWKTNINFWPLILNWLLLVKNKVLSSCTLVCLSVSPSIPNSSEAISLSWTRVTIKHTFGSCIEITEDNMVWDDVRQYSIREFIKTESRKSESVHRGAAVVPKWLEWFSRHEEPKEGTVCPGTRSGLKSTLSVLDWTEDQDTTNLPLLLKSRPHTKATEKWIQGEKWTQGAS